MKKIILISICSLSFLGFSQKSANWCGTDKKLQQRIDNSPGMAEEIHQSMSIAAASQSGHEKVIKTIPVVFHILHDNGIGNISLAQIQSTLDVLNRDFNRLNLDTVNTRLTPTAPFKTNAASMQIQFILAKIDPNGNCTNGIERKDVASNITYEIDMNSEPHKFTSSGGLNAWPRNKYFNVWIVNSIDVPNPDGSIILGYAQFPDTWGGPANTYGLTMRQDYTGTVGTAAGEDGRTITHEVGHCFGLLHTFQGGCHSNNCNNNGDYCCDTPPQSEAFYSCSSTLNSCTQTPTNDAYGFDALDQIENYMSYNACQNMFSYDQATIMESEFTSLSYLTSLASSANAAATGINLPAAMCKADFISNKTTVCVGDQIQFTDDSYNSANGWTWNFPSGTPSTSTSQNPLITYSTPGIYEVTLTATDGSVSDSETKTQYIKVLENSSSLPFFEGFELYSSLSATNNWQVVNPGSNNAFVLENTVGHSGTKSVKLINFGQSGANLDELIASPVDLSGVTAGNGGVTLSFRYAYRKRLAADNECLKVFLTSNCGTTWAQRKTLCGASLSNTTVSSSWTPTSITDWTTVHMTNVTSDYWVDNFNYKFNFEGANGNNIFLDDINIYSGGPSDNIVLTVSEQGEIDGLSLYPNPAENEVNIEFTVQDAKTVQIQIQDVTGKIVQNHNVIAAIGANLVMIDTQSMAAGSYFIAIKSGDAQKVLQFVIK